MNPARSLGPALISEVWNAHWVYLIAPVLGAVGGRSSTVGYARREQTPPHPILKENDHD